MLNGELVEVDQDVLEVGVLLVAVLAAEVVDPVDALQTIINDGDEDDDAQRVQPDDDDGDNVGPAVGRVVKGRGRRRPHDAAAAARQPAEQAEDGGDDVDAQDGEAELPRRPRLAAARHEDEPVLRQRHLQEEHLLDGAEPLDDAAAAQEHGATSDPGSGGQQQS